MSGRLARGLRRSIRWIRGLPDIPPGVSVGRNAYVSRGVTFDYGYARHITIEDDATLVGGSIILCHDASSFRRLGVTWVAPVRVCKGAYVGARAILLPGVTVGERSVVAAGSIVTHDVPPGVVVGGVPARPIETTAELDQRRRAQLAESPAFDRSLFKGADLPPERAALLNEAIATHGGYFVTRRPSTTAPEDHASRTTSVRWSRRRKGAKDE